VAISPAEALYRHIQESLRNLNCHERRFLLAGRPVSLQATADGLLELLYQAFDHLPVSAAAPELTIRIGEKHCADFISADALAGGQTVGGHRFWVSPDNRYFSHTLLSSGSFYCIDRAANEIVGCVESADRLSTFERAKPVVRPLLLWLEQCGLTPVHAGTVGWQGKGILFGGRAGSGKSTASLSSLQAGLDMLAEDYTLLEPAGERDFIAHSLYNSAWIEAEHLHRFPGLEQFAIHGDEMANGKSILLLREIYPDRFLASAPVRYLILPRVCPGGLTALRRASRSEAIKRFALESLVTLTRLGAAELDRLVAVVHSTDCYWLDLGRNLDEVGVLLKNLAESDER